MKSSLLVFFGSLSVLFLVLVVGRVQAEKSKLKPDSAKINVVGDPKKGKQIYEQSCQLCHGQNGDGKGVASAAMKNKPRNFQEGKFKYGGSRKQLFKTISAGVPGTPMPAWGHIPEQDRRDVIEYILKFNMSSKK